MVRTIQTGGFRCAMRFDIEGIGARAEAARDRTLGQVGEYIRAQSTAIAPHRSGRLAASAQVVSGVGKVTVRYGAAYAAIQHDRTDYRHPGGGQARFLQSVMEDPATAREAERILADELARSLQ